MQSDNEVRYVNQPSRVSAFLPMIMMAVVLLLAMFILMALGFKDAPFLSAGFVIIIVVFVVGGSLWWVSDNRTRSRAHAEQMSTVIPSTAQAVAPAVAQAVMQLVGGIMAQTWPAGDQGGSTPMAIFRPPRAVTPQLPARVVSVMRYTNEHRQAIPLGAPPYQPIVLETKTGDDDEIPGATLQVGLNFLMRFAACPTPARSEWQGKPQTYGDAARFFMSHGMLNTTTRGGYAWRPEYPAASRRAWLMQYESAREGAPQE